jgi:hypothetical protein
MTPNILEVLNWDTRLREYTWFDLGEYTQPRHAAVQDAMRKQQQAGTLVLPLYSEFLPEDLPMPFDMFGTVMMLPGGESRLMIIAVTFDRKGNDLRVIIWHPVGGTKLILLQVGAKSAKRDGTPDLVYDGDMLDKIRKTSTYKGRSDEHIVGVFSEQVREIYWLLMMDVLERKKSMPSYKPLPNPTNDKRIRKGKKPLFEWKVIDVTAKHVVPESSAPTGRKQASPRRHVRRGHQRTLTNGKKIWIKQMMVGKIEFGYIHHSYTTQGERR